MRSNHPSNTSIELVSVGLSGSFTTDATRGIPDALVQELSYIDAHLRLLFSGAQKWVILYSSNQVPSGHTLKHVRHREFLSLIHQHVPGWPRFEQDSIGAYSMPLAGRHA